MLILLTTLSASSGKQLFSLTLSTLKQPLKSGEKLLLRVTVTNTSDHNIPFLRTNNPLSNEEFRYKIEVRDVNGQSALPSAQVRALEGQITQTEDFDNHAYWLKPGESFSDDLEITKLYDLTQPGKYTVSVGKQILARQVPPEGTAKSNSVTFTVIP